MGLSVQRFTVRRLPRFRAGTSTRIKFPISSFKFQVSIFKYPGKQMERRGFIKKGLSWLAYILGTAALAYPVFSFINFRKIRKKTVVFYPDEQLAAANFKEGVYLIRKGTDFNALSARCTHLGCTLNFDAVSQQFKCPCHGSLFAISGKRISGPAKKNLISIPVKTVANGDMEVEYEI